MSTELIVRPPDHELDLMTLGKVLASSGYFSDAKDAAQAVVKVLAGRELGLGAVASMTGIYLVKGKVALSANLMAAQIKRSGRYNYRVLRLDDTGCEIVFTEGGQEIGRSAFSEADAKAAGLTSNETYRKFPRNMYFARALSNGARWYTPDIFAGPVYTPDELRADSDAFDSAPPAPLPPAPAVNVITGEIVEGAAFDGEREQALAGMRTAFKQAKQAGAEVPTPDKSAVATMSVTEILDWADVYRTAAQDAPLFVPA